MKISTSERKGCFPSSTEASGEIPLLAQHLPDLTQASTLMLQGADAPRPDPSWSRGEALTRAETAPCSWPGFTAKKHQHKAVTQEIPDYRRRGSTKREKTEPCLPAPPTWGCAPSCRRVRGSDSRTSATTEHARGSRVYNTRFTLKGGARVVCPVSSLEQDQPGASPPRP